MALKLQPLLLLEYDPNKLCEPIGIAALLHCLVINPNSSVDNALCRLETQIIDARFLLIERFGLLH